MSRSRMTLPAGRKASGHVLNKHKIKYCPNNCYCVRCPIYYVQAINSCQTVGQFRDFKPRLFAKVGHRPFGRVSTEIIKDSLPELLGEQPCLSVPWTVDLVHKLRKTPVTMLATMRTLTTPGWSPTPVWILFLCN